MTPQLITAVVWECGGNFGSSLKGEAAIDWDDKAQRDQLLSEIVQDGQRLLSLAEQGKEQHPEQGRSDSNRGRFAAATEKEKLAFKL